ncbi:MAG: DUF6599 family protein [Acidobacteriota bacterium]
MHLEKQRPAVLALILVLISPLAIGARQAPAGEDQPASAAVTPLASSSPLARLLPGSLARLRATSDIKPIGGDNLVELVGDKAAIYEEYRVTSAASREYAGVRVDVFETENQFAALGLFMFNCGASRVKPIEEDIGSGGARLDGELVFWKGTFFVRVGDPSQKPSRVSSTVREALARAVADAIVPMSAVVTRPPLLDSLPAASLVPQSQRYFLGPESLDAFLEHGRAMFEFAGDTEAVMAQYAQGEGPNSGAPQTQATGQTQAKMESVARSAPGAPDSPLKLLIVEFHTPQFATDAMARVTSYVSSLPETDQQHIIFKRTGNYLVEAVNVRDREFAESLVNSVQYPYTVKWLRNPLWPVNDPFRMEKTADMLLSTFGLLGLILATVLVGGSVFGTTIFLKRRKQQREVFSDAGGMLRLDIEPFESVMLRLPPKRSEE